LRENVKAAEEALRTAETALKGTPAESLGAARAEVKRARKALAEAQAAYLATVNPDDDQAVIDLAMMLGRSDPPNESRTESIRQAMKAGASYEVIGWIATSVRVFRNTSIVLPAGRYESCSRGKGWCRLGKGSAAQWGDRVNGGYQVDTPGKWIVGSNDGYNRKGETTWTVEHVKIGENTWTIAN